MAKHGLRNGNSYKNQYKNYNNNDSFTKNKIVKLKRTVKNQPNNEMAKDALKKALKTGCTYTRNNDNVSNSCKGKCSILGWIKNHVNKENAHKIRFSSIWHISPNYSKWFLPSAPKLSKQKS